MLVRAVWERRAPARHPQEKHPRMTQMRANDIWGRGCAALCYLGSPQYETNA